MALTRLRLALLSLAALTECAHPPSDLVLRIDSDLDPEVEYDSVRVRFVRVGDSSAVNDRTYDLRASSLLAFPLPVSQVLYARDPTDARPLSIQMDAMLVERVVSTQRVLVSFAPQQTVAASVFLARRCGAGVLCPGGQTCGRRGCEPELRTTEAWRSDAVALSAGGNTTCVRGARGAIRCWGSNSRAQLGAPSEGERWSTTPTALALNTVAQQVSVGGEHACARVSLGSVACWGAETAVRGAGDGALRVDVVALPLREITEGGTHGCGRDRDGSVRCWGPNGQGQLGVAAPPAASITEPVQVPGLPNLNGGSISAGRAHTCVVVADGRGFCWGDNAQGQLGDGSNTAHAGPVAVMGAPGLSSVASGGRHTCALDRDGAVWCWGSGDSGQRGAMGTSPAPSRVAGPPPLVAIGSGAEHTCALAPNGAVWCWGANTFGQVDPGGDGTPQAPQAVGGVPPSVALALGERHTCALTAGGAVWCWGANDLGQLGDGSTVRRTAPVMVTGL